MPTTTQQFVIVVIGLLILLMLLPFDSHHSYDDAIWGDNPMKCVRGEETILTPPTYLVPTLICKDNNGDFSHWAKFTYDDLQKEVESFYSNPKQN